MSIKQQVDIRPGSILVGATLTLDGTIQTFPAYNRPLIGLIVQADPGNAGNVNVYATGGGAVVHVLQPGSSLSLDITNISQVRVGGTASDIVRWAGLQQA